MDMPAAGSHAGFEGLQQGVEPRQRIIANGTTLLAQRFEIAEVLRGVGAAQLEMRLETAQCDLEIGITQRLVRGGCEIARVLGHVSGSPRAGSAPIFASTSATWRTRKLLPCRSMRPARCKRQPRSPPTKVSAPVFRASAILSSAMRSEISGYLTENNP